MDGWGRQFSITSSTVSMYDQNMNKLEKGSYVYRMHMRSHKAFRFEEEVSQNYELYDIKSQGFGSINLATSAPNAVLFSATQESLWLPFAVLTPNCL